MMQKSRPNNGYDNENSHQGLKSAHVLNWGKRTVRFFFFRESNYYQL